MAAGASKAARTRRRVLEAAEQHFAEHGFAAARLEDVAADVGVKRAALFYHFRDKRDLHEAVLQDVFGALLARLQEIMADDRPFAERAERAAAAWVDLVAERPSLAPLILREAVSEEREWRRLVPIAAPFLDWMRHELREAADEGAIDPVDEDPLVLLGALVGASLPGGAADRSLDERRGDAVRLVRRLLAPR